MRKLTFFSLSFICLMFLSVSAKASDFAAEFNEYEIEEAENMKMNFDADKVWNIKYKGCKNPVYVIRRNVSHGVVYIVNSEFFEVCYSATSKGFGTRYLKKAWSTVPHQLNSAVINPEALKMQQIITPNKVDDKQALELIAVFLPGLINENYKHLLQ